MTTRQSRRRQRVLEAGGSQLSLLIDRKATTCLDEIVRRTGETKTQAIQRLIWLGGDPAMDGGVK